MTAGRWEGWALVLLAGLVLVVLSVSEPELEQGHDWRRPDAEFTR